MTQQLNGTPERIGFWLAHIFLVAFLALMTLAMVGTIHS
jgi:hypothetical protein